MVRPKALHIYRYFTSHYLLNGSGNSMSTDPPVEEALKCALRLRDWLGRIFDRRFVLQTQAFPIGIQDDGSSCGICVMNAMEHLVFNVELFTHETRFLHRVRYFVELVKYTCDQVRCVSEILKISSSNLFSSYPCTKSQHSFNSFSIFTTIHSRKDKTNDHIGDTITW